MNASHPVVQAGVSVVGLATGGAVGSATGNGLVGIIIGGLFGLAIPIGGIIIAVINRRGNEPKTTPPVDGQVPDVLNVQTRLTALEEVIVGIRQDATRNAGECDARTTAVKESLDRFGSDIRKELNEMHEDIGRLQAGQGQGRRR